MEQSREEFEKWRRSLPYVLNLGFNKDTGEYVMREDRDAWAAWKASRAAVVVKLPTKGMGLEDFFTKGINQTIDNCKKAIEAQGLTVK